jgi:TolB-like protein
MPFVFESIGKQTLKGFEQPVRAFAVHLKQDESIPVPDVTGNKDTGAMNIMGTKSFLVIAGSLLAMLVIGGWVWWSASRAPDSLTGIAIMPLENLGEKPDDYFAYGLSEDIGTALARFSNLLVYPAKVTKKFSPAESSCKEIAAALNANYVLEGTVLRSDNTLRATVMLLDAHDCTQIWSESYDRSVTTSTDVFSVRDDITNRVAGSIGSPGNPVWESERQQESTDNLEAYECILQSMSRLIIMAEGHRKTRECMERAVELDPDYAEAHARLGFVYINSHKYKYPHVRPKPLELAYYHIQRALQLSPRNQRALYALANYLFYTDFTGFESFYAAAEAAIEVNPNDVEVLADLGNLITYSGDWERGIALSERARELDPNHANWMYYPSFLDLYRREKYQEALALMLKMNYPNNYPMQTNLAAVYGQLGEIEKAKEILEHIREIHPLFDSDPRAPFVTRRMPANFIETIMDGLRKAGYDVPPVKTE